MLMAGLMLVSLALMAQETLPEETAGTFIDVTTFGGMMVLVSAICTEVAKLIPYIADHKWAKVLSSVVIGIGATMACWGLQVSDYLSGLVWWQALIAGVAVGLSSSGFYDVIKALWSIFKPKEEAK